MLFFPDSSISIDGAANGRKVGATSHHHLAGGGEEEEEEEKEDKEGEEIRMEGYLQT